MLPSCSDPLRVFIGVGGNEVGSRSAFLQARSELFNRLSPLKWASLYSSAPQIDVNQPNFLNTVFEGLWTGTPDELLHLLGRLEMDAGRHRDPARPKGPRILDLDLLLVGSVCLDTPNLTLPHPGMKTRRFVLEPLLELDVALRDPVTNRPYREFWETVQDQGVYRLDGNW